MQKRKEVRINKINVELQNLLLCDKKNIQKSYEEFAAEKDRKLFDSGFTRVVVEEAFHLICPELERRLSLIYAEGLRKYKDNNIKEAEITTSRFGGPPDNIIRHMRRHLNLWLSGNREEDHLAKVVWGIAELMHQESDGACQHLNMLLEEKNRIEVKRKHL